MWLSSEGNGCTAAEKHEESGQTVHRIGSVRSINETENIEFFVFPAK
jgi:hypothetical protein